MRTTKWVILGMVLLAAGPAWSKSFVYGGGGMAFPHGPDRWAENTSNAIAYEFGLGQTFNSLFSMAAEYGGQTFPLVPSKLGVPASFAVSGGDTTLSYLAVMGQIGFLLEDGGAGLFCAGGLGYANAVTSDITIRNGSLTASVAGDSSGGWVGVFNAGLVYPFGDFAATLKYKGVFEDATSDGVKISAVILGFSWATDLFNNL